MTATNDVSGRRILIIDDNEDAAQLLSFFVMAMGHACAVANSGADGLAVASEFCPEIVFLDLAMPGMSGYEVAPRLRSIPALGNVYIAALTGWNDAKTRQKVVECGFDRHLTKPASLDLIQEVLTCLD